MKHSIRLQSICAMLAITLCCTSCMSTRVISLHDSDSVVKNTKTTWSFAWGLVSPKDINAKCESKYLSSATNTTNFGYILLSTITLGIVVPQIIEWECAPPDSQINEL
ncbi:hypothetical protein ATE84_3545 [Aquimarina sp. MAR_2010_214]|uniref:hypothetical protein n=1 Tax=Aquimarina sp. MAR_2010_214 TaxID=1250026 RepID=UPI000CB1E1D4|nr:hypothetical protein [Aquimarina sp. MAR_2010_214]PKV51460.1 hypothetical protein ATE84_3545 [Aquimarina sp. MAR_2010_214]